MWWSSTPKANKRLDNLEDDLRSLKRDLEALELEWSNVYDKIRAAMGRIVKREAIMEKDTGGARQAQMSAPTDSPGPDGRSYTADQMMKQQEILRRRARL